MKKTMFLLLSGIMTASILIGCKAKEENKLKVMIESSIKKNMNEPDSYEFVSMSQLDSIMSKWEDEKQARQIEIFISMYEAEYMALMAKADAKYSYTVNQRIKFTEQAGNNIKKIDSLKYLNLEKRTNYKPYVTGYTSEFKIRELNELGAKVLNTYLVTLNDSLTTIISLKLIN